MFQVDWYPASRTTSDSLVVLSRLAYEKTPPESPPVSSAGRYVMPETLSVVVSVSTAAHDRKTSPSPSMVAAPSP